jgi:hypothetical protein
MQQYLEWAGVEHDPTWSADDPEANGLTERFMQTIGKSWATAYVEGKDPMSALNAALKSYRNTEHAVTKRKPAEWLFGREIRTRLPQLIPQTQCEDEESIAAKERIRERGVREKQRHDKKTREEELKVGMQVLLKYKQKKKGMPRYDPNPFTITELVGRQAVLQRGTTTLRRETQKFKKLHTPKNGAAVHSQDDREWEESRSAKSKETTASVGNTTVSQTTTNNTAGEHRDTTETVTNTQMTVPDTTDTTVTDQQTEHAPRNSTARQNRERPTTRSQTRSQGNNLSWNPAMNASDVLIETNSAH